MNEKEQNRKTAGMIAENPFWRSAFFPRYFTEDFTMDYPSAPPGMPQHFDVWESERCFEWLNRTVKCTQIMIDEFYGTPDPGQFWSVGQISADVFWGSRDGHFDSRFFMRLECQAGRIRYLKLWMDPLALLRAAGREVPVFHMDLYDEKVDEWLRVHPSGPHAASDTEEEQEISPEVIAQRRRDNLDENFCGIDREKYRALETTAPGYTGGAWFIPHEMDQVVPCHVPQRLNGDDFPPEIAERGHAWTKSSSPWMYRDTRGRLYPTDDKNMFFIEMYGHGPGRWRGNGCDNGHYHQPYLLIERLDDEGRIVIRDEVLNPLNKYNCVNISIPSFPYYH